VEDSHALSCDILQASTAASFGLPEVSRGLFPGWAKPAHHGAPLPALSHDLNVIRYMSHRVAVLYQGELVELAQNAEFFANPRHGHSKELVAAALPCPKAVAATTSARAPASESRASHALSLVSTAKDAGSTG
jgi:enoyl-CoA hydratase/carnithine racemase